MAEDDAATTRALRTVDALGIRAYATHAAEEGFVKDVDP